MDTEGVEDAKSKRNCCFNSIWREPSVTSSTISRDIIVSDVEDGSRGISRRHSPTIHQTRFSFVSIRKAVSPSKISSMTVPVASFFEVDDAATLSPRAKTSSDMSPNTLISQSNFTIHTKSRSNAAYGETLAKEGLNAV